MAGGWKTEKTEVVHENPIFTLKKDTIVLPNNRLMTWHYFDAPDFVVVPGLTSDGKIMAIRQFRYMLGKHCIEFAAGAINAGESPEAAATREFEEETGYRPGKIISMGSFYESVSKSRNKVHFFLAKDIVKTRQSLDANEKGYEEIEPLVLEMEEMERMMPTMESGVSALAFKLMTDHIRRHL